jgi:GT2 family glycosyltransferase
MTNIVMLCRNRLRLTEQALRSLYANTPREEFTLTLVDDASEDFRTIAMLERFAENANATLVRVEKSAHVLARGKNLGVFWSRQTFGCGEWLYLSDNDVCFMPNWREKLTMVAVDAEKSGFKLIGGQIHPYHQPIHVPADSSRFGWTEHLVLDGPSWLLRWKTWRLMGELDPRCAPGTCQGEDGGWCDRLRARGGRIGVIHPHVVVHTGLTNSAGEDAPGRDAREAGRVKGVLYE